MKRSTHRLFIKARNFRRNHREARDRDALAAALREKPRYYPCAACHWWHPVGWRGACIDKAFTSGHLNLEHGDNGWDQAAPP